MSTKAATAEKNGPAKESPTRSRAKSAHTSESSSNLFDFAAAQRSAGNLAIQHLFRSTAIQTKLAISRPDDPSEQEADRVAEQVMRMRDLAGENETAISGRADPHPIQRACSECDELLHRQKAEEEEEEEKPIHTKPLVSQITPLIQRQVEDEQNIVATTPLGQRIAEPEQEEDEEETVSPKLEPPPRAAVTAGTLKSLTTAGAALKSPIA